MPTKISDGEKRIVVLVDLLNYGIIELPIVYNLAYEERGEIVYGEFQR